MEKYNTQLDEVKKELKTCKSKMDSQSKQVSEYTKRLDDYDKKFEENSRKFGNLLTELNKCKTEQQYYRSRSHLLQCLNRGSSLNDQPSDIIPDTRNNVDFANAQVGFEAFPGVDKQAMIEDWLNPVTGEVVPHAPYLPVAPQVQHFKDTPDYQWDSPDVDTEVESGIPDPNALHNAP